MKKIIITIALANLISISISPAFANGKTFVLHQQKPKRTSLLKSKFVYLEEESSPMISEPSGSSAAATQNNYNKAASDTKGMSNFSNQLTKKTPPPQKISNATPSNNKFKGTNASNGGRGGTGSGNAKGSGHSSGYGNGRGGSDTGTDKQKSIISQNIHDESEWNGYAVEKEVEIEESLDVKAKLIN